MKVEISEKSALQSRLKELEEQYRATEARLKEEVGDNFSRIKFQS